VLGSAEKQSPFGPVSCPLESVYGTAWEQLDLVKAEAAPKKSLRCQSQRFLVEVEVDAGKTCKINVIALDVVLLLGAALDCTEDVPKAADDDEGADIRPKVVDELRTVAMLVVMVTGFDRSGDDEDTATLPCATVVDDWLGAADILGETIVEEIAPP